MSLEAIIGLVAAGAAVIGLVSGWIGAHIGNRVAMVKTEGRVGALEDRADKIDIEIAYLRKAKHDHAGHRTILEGHEGRLDRLEAWRDRHDGA